MLGKAPANSHNPWSVDRNEPLGFGFRVCLEEFHERAFAAAG